MCSTFHLYVCVGCPYVSKHHNGSSCQLSSVGYAGGSHRVRNSQQRSRETAALKLKRRWKLCDKRIIQGPVHAESTTWPPSQNIGAQQWMPPWWISGQDLFLEMLLLDVSPESASVSPKITHLKNKCCPHQWEWFAMWWVSAGQNYV